LHQCIRLLIGACYIKRAPHTSRKETGNAASRQRRPGRSSDRGCRQFDRWPTGLADGSAALLPDPQTPVRSPSLTPHVHVVQNQCQHLATQEAPQCQTYISLINFTPKGLENIKDAAKRLDAAKQRYRAAGAELKASRAGGVHRPDQCGLRIRHLCRSR
jgi:hypothetical protein